MTESKKSVFDAIGKIGNALDGLSPDEQRRAIDSAVAALGLGPSLANVASTREPSGEVLPPLASSAPPTGKRQSLVEFMTKSAPATNPQRIAVFAAYRDQVEGLGTFARADIEPYFAKARAAAPKNFKRDFTDAVSEGWICEDGSNSYLTLSGETVVANGFGGKGKARGKASAKKPGKKASKKGAGSA